jgi:hypothetical protein
VAPNSTQVGAPSRALPMTNASVNIRIPSVRIQNEEDDPRNFRCGHNFEPTECPYEHCAVRELAIAAERCPAAARATVSHLFSPCNNCEQAGTFHTRIIAKICILFARQEHRPSLQAVLAAVEQAITERR